MKSEKDGGMKKYFFILLTMFMSCASCLIAHAADNRDAMIDAQVFAPTVDASTSDGKAAVYQIEGKAVITPKGSPVERDLKVGDEIQMGDSVYTEKGANLSISFDNRKQNAVRIPAETKATFTSIEPTDIKLEDGTIFSVVNGLAKGSTWKVTTPSAVAAVRGTVFETTYHADTKEFFAATLDVSDDGKTSAIEIESLVGEGMAEVVEGKEISFKEGEVPSQEMVQDFSAEKMVEVQHFHHEVATEREKSSDDQNKGPGGPNGPGGGNNPGSGISVLGGGNGPSTGGPANANSPYNPTGSMNPFSTGTGANIAMGGGNNNPLGLGGLGGLIGGSAGVGGPSGSTAGEGGGMMMGGPNSSSLGGGPSGPGFPNTPGGPDGPNGPGFPGGTGGPDGSPLPPMIPFPDNPVTGSGGFGGCTAGDPNCGGNTGGCPAGQTLSGSGGCY